MVTAFWSSGPFYVMENNKEIMLFHLQSIKTASFFIFIFKFAYGLPIDNRPQCSGNVSLLEFRLPLQYVKLGQDFVHLSHFVSPTLEPQMMENLPGQFSIWQHLNRSGDWHCANILGGLILVEPSGQCHAECLTALRPMVNLEGRNAEMRWIPQEQFEFRPAEFISFDGIPPMFCTKEWGQCGARIPLYSFYSEFKRDQILSIETELDDAEYEMEFDGQPLCYIWPFPLLEVLLQNSEQSSKNTQAPKNQKEHFGCEIVEITARFGHSLYGQPILSNATTANSLLKHPLEKSIEENEENCCPESTSSSPDYLEQTFSDEVKSTESVKNEPSLRKGGSIQVDWPINNANAKLLHATMITTTTFVTTTKTTTMIYTKDFGQQNHPKIASAGVIGPEGADGEDEFIRFFKSQNWLHNWRWWILIGALSALIFCCCIISTLLCHLLCLQSFIAICHGQNQQSKING